MISIKLYKKSILISVIIIFTITIFTGLVNADGGPDWVNIGDYVWYDINYNGVQDTDEPGISNVTVKLYRSDDTLIMVTKTDDLGNYKFTTFVGSYYVKFILPSGFKFTHKDKGFDDTKDSDADIITGKTNIIHMIIDVDNMTIDAGLIDCPDTVWVDDSWNSQSDVDDIDLTWNFNAFNNIQDAVNIVCDCGTVNVLDGNYPEQVLINKNLSLYGSPGATLVVPGVLDFYTINGSNDSWAPLIFAFGGVLSGFDVSGHGRINVMVDGFDFVGDGVSGVVGVLFHNVESGCTTSVISNSTFDDFDIAIMIDGCSGDSTIIHNRIFWPDNTMDKIGILIRSSISCEPENVEIHHNFIGIECGWNIGVWNQVSIIVNATFNWWGAPDGPSSPDDSDNFDVYTGRIADGFGEKVIGLVHFDPWAGIDAVISASQTNILIGTPIYFTTNDCFACHINGTFFDYDAYWDFDDGFFSFEKQTSHVFETTGIYHVSLRIQAIDTQLMNNFMYDFDDVTITVYDPDQPLTASIDTKYLDESVAYVDNKINFFALAFGGVPPYSYKWDFGDSTNSSSQNPTHTYRIEGDYTVVLTITDTTNKQVSDKMKISVLEKTALTANAGGPYQTMIGEEIVITASATGGTGKYIYLWKINDDIQIEGKNLYYIFEEPGIYDITLIVTDSNRNKVYDHTSISVGLPPKLVKIKGGNGIEAIIDSGSMITKWSMTINGRFVYLDNEIEGTLQPETTTTIRLKKCIGFGRVDIKLTVDSQLYNYKAIMIGTYILLTSK